MSRVTEFLIFNPNGEVYNLAIFQSKWITSLQSYKLIILQSYSCKLLESPRPIILRQIMSLFSWQHFPEYSTEEPVPKNFANYFMTTNVKIFILSFCPRWTAFSVFSIFSTHADTILLVTPYILLLFWW